MISLISPIASSPTPQQVHHAWPPSNLAWAEKGRMATGFVSAKKIGIVVWGHKKKLWIHVFLMWLHHLGKWMTLHPVASWLQVYTGRKFWGCNKTAKHTCKYVYIYIHIHMYKCTRTERTHTWLRTSRYRSPHMLKSEWIWFMLLDISQQECSKGYVTSWKGLF